MDNTELKNAYDLCTLVRCALAGQAPCWEDMDLDAVHRMAKQHSLGAISYMALEGTGATLHSEWKQERDMALRKQLLLQMERQQIQSQLDAMGCWYMPLKGSILAELYPRPGMRQMADNDILFDARYQEAVKELFLRRGYKCKSYGNSHHDVYLKAPVYNFEMHTALFEGTVYESLNRYYQNIIERLIPEKGMAHRFSPEDFYLYLLAHGHKHFSNSGNGLRFLADCYVYLQKHALDRDYIAAELPCLGIADFEPLVRGLSQKLFGTGEALTDAEEETFRYCVGSGAYGTSENRIGNQLKRIQAEGSIRIATKLKYLLRRLWPDMQWFRQNAPFFAKCWVLQPLYIVWRCLRGLVLRGKFIIREIRFVSKSDEK